MTQYPLADAEPTPPSVLVDEAVGSAHATHPGFSCKRLKKTASAVKLANPPKGIFTFHFNLNPPDNFFDASAAIPTMPQPQS
mmetsp:Transcript_3554/g.5553  ORF Transcript_3554/g.5553 Transcript_3554/m.5553 type:complete len:82 (+) Transcript_3554:190-435(+)